MSGKFQSNTVYCEGEAKIEPFKKAAGQSGGFQTSRAA
jgi:hypothetical protein